MKNEQTPPPEFIDALESLLEGNPDGARLVSQLEKDPGLAAVAADHFLVAGALADHEVDDEKYTREMVAHVTRLAAADETDFERAVWRRIHYRRWRAPVMIAAALALLAVPLVLVFSRKAPDSVATMTRVQPGQPSDAAEPIVPGRKITAASGLLRLNFHNGAVIAIEAPAEFTVVSGMEISLAGGRLNGWCPETARGFRVRTGTACLTDLGTSFGVNSSGGKSEFVVLSGLVEVERDREKIRMTEGDALEATSTEPLKPVGFEPSAFKNTWALSYGIVSTRGAVVPANPDIQQNLLHLEDDAHVLVIPERREVPRNRPILAEITGAGSLPGSFDGTALQVDPAPGKRVSSFLIRYDPVGEYPESEFVHFQGEVTFDRPVLAIACHRESLEHGDVVFARGNWGSRFRGIELQQIDNAPDGVTLSADRRTVTVDFYAGASTDEVRVILEDN